MATSVQLSGGAGFGFEDKVAGHFLASMLSGLHAYGPDVGTVTSVGWQTRGAGWLLDDLGISFHGQDSGTLALSIKSDRQVNGASGFPAGFAGAAWQQWADARVFHRDRDLLGLAVGELASTVMEAWQNLLQQARLGDPDEIARRYSTSGGSHQIGRVLFRSLQPPGSTDSTGVARLVSRLRLLHFDFAETESQSEASGVRACQLTLDSGDVAEAMSLWNRLVGIAAERRGAGGFLDGAGLVQILRREFQLKDHPNHEAAWRCLDRRSLERADDIVESVGGRVCLIRREVMDTLYQPVREGQCVVVAGDGGTGKSAVVKRLAGWSDFSRFLWLDGTALDFDSLDDAAGHFGISVSIPDLLARSSAATSCLVLDGLEKFTPRARARTVALLKSLAPDPFARGWTVVTTTRPQSVDEVRQMFRRADIDLEQVATRYVQQPTDAECAVALGAFPSLPRVLIRRELRTSIANLKVLDWVLSDADTFDASEVNGWIGTTTVLDSLWRRWVGTGASAAVRAGVMKKLSKLEGEGLRSSVALSELQTAEHAALHELESLELLRLKDERIAFRHDMLGDWARVRLLVEMDPASPAAVAALARSPRWHDAIRLYGQRLLESDALAPKQWTDLVEGLADPEPMNALASDLLLESLFSSVGARALMEHAWSTLAARDGALLRRLLKKFEYAATIPDPRVGELVEDPAERIEVGAHWRFPWWPLWPGVLRVIAAHAGEVATLAPFEAARLCALWLRSMPIGASSRRDAATAALAIGRETQAREAEGRWHGRDELAKTVYEAVLLAASELPEAIADLSLQLARRRPDPPEVTIRASAYAERVQRQRAQRTPDQPPRPRSHGSGAGRFFEGPMRPQFADGPATRVDDGFRSAVLESQGILALASVRPEAAEEVLLACCLEAPKPEQLDGIDVLGRLGVEFPPKWLQPMFFDGPWLALLRQDPLTGIDAINRLVNQATREWERGFVPRDASPLDRAHTRLTVVTGAESVEYVGDNRVFGWYRDRLCNAHVMVSALMALERWLYEQLDGDLQVDDSIARILAGSQSAAIIGLLVAVGKYRTRLFSGPLAPLLGVWRIYEWDIQLSMSDDVWQIGLFRWGSSGERIFKMVRDWHTMEHRKRLLRDFAVWRLFSQEPALPLFAEMRARWRTEIDSNSCISPESLKLLIARLDPANYTRRSREDGRIELQLNWPDDLRSDTEASLKESAAGMQLVLFPTKCRKLLQSGNPLSDQQANALWAELQSIAPLDASSIDAEFSADRKAASILGGIAVLSTLAPSWLSSDESRREWCAAQQESVQTHPPPPPHVDSEHSISIDCWHSFQADTAIAMLANAPADSNARAAAAAALMSRWYATTGVALTAAYSHRARLGIEFGRLVNVAVLWSALRCIRVPYPVDERAHSLMLARRRRLIGAFVRFGIPDHEMDWNAIGAAGSRAHDRLRRRHFSDGKYSRSSEEDTPSRPGSVGFTHRRRRQSRSHPGFDTEVLRCGFSWLASPDQAISRKARSDDLNWVRRLLAVVLNTIPKCPADEEVDGTPYEFDTWVFELVANSVAQMRPDESPESLWQPILDLGPQAHYWVEQFLSRWLVSGPRAASSPTVFFDRWREMMDFAWRSPIWMPQRRERHWRIRGIWEHLLGMGLGAGTVGAAEHQQQFAGLIPVYRKWADEFLDDDRSLRAFLSLLRQPGARLLVCPALPWILRVGEQISPREWASDSLADSVASILRDAWAEHAEAIAGDSELLKSFMALLNLLVAQQSHPAMDLRDRVVRTVPTA